MPLCRAHCDIHINNMANYDILFWMTSVCSLDSEQNEQYGSWRSNTLINVCSTKVSFS